ncbi:MAG: squalene/phytoene synthase family protein [Methylophilaceae bacterium]|nr:squalene/phytoene synthase family protein [Methylophilaceae bacterium]
MHSGEPSDIPLREVLKGTSRSFYLSLRFLPKATRSQTALAYLLARAADSLADAPSLPAKIRLNALHQFRQALEENNGQAPVFSAAIMAAPDNPREQELLQQLPLIFTPYAALSTQDRHLLRAVLRTLTGGMVDDLQRFPSGELHALSTRAELDAYTYAVAGCVGEFWTRIHAAHLPALKDLDIETNIERGVRLGKGLQLVNVLRDLPRDLAGGRCYLPLEDLSAVGLTPDDLHNPQNWPKLKPVIHAWSERALAHFEEGFLYILALPACEKRLRLCSWWPLALGLQTIALLRQSENLLESGRIEKVSRRWVYKLLINSTLRGASDAYLRSAYSKLRKQSTDSK